MTTRAGIYVLMQIYEQQIYIYNLRTIRNSLDDIRCADTILHFEYLDSLQTHKNHSLVKILTIVNIDWIYQIIGFGIIVLPPLSSENFNDW